MLLCFTMLAENISIHAYLLVNFYIYELLNSVVKKDTKMFPESFVNGTYIYICCEYKLQNFCIM